MKRLIINVTMLLSLMAASFYAAAEPQYKSTFEDTPLGFAVSFVLEDEGYTLSNPDSANSRLVSGTFTGETVLELVNSMAGTVGYTVHVSGTTITLANN